MANQFQDHISPEGVAVYPWLNKPDTKFDPDGVFSVKLLFDKTASKEISDVVKPLMNGGKNNPIKPELDDQGQKTGNYLVNFKMKAHIRKKDGDSFDQTPLLSDKLGNRMQQIIAGGSTLKIKYQAIPYDGMGGGVSLRMKEVRVLDLVEYQPKEQSADWGECEGSYVAPKDEPKLEVVKEAVDEEEEDF